MSDTYTLTCSSCGNSYYSKEAFPKHQHCKTCTLAFRAGIKEVVEWLERHNNDISLPMGEDEHFHIYNPEEWHEQLKEWGCL